MTSEFLQMASQNPSEPTFFRRRTVFPVLRRGCEPPPVLILRPYQSERPSTTEKKFQLLDGRLCLFCSLAGDDYSYAGRLLAIGHDVWGHIGCLYFASTKKRVFDYTLFKVSVRRTFFYFLIPSSLFVSTLDKIKKFWLFFFIVICLFSTFFQLSNLDAPQFRRTECTVCPIPRGVVGCAQKLCNRSYHMNCAVLENCVLSSCLLTGQPGVSIKDFCFLGR